MKDPAGVASILPSNRITRAGCAFRRCTRSTSKKVVILPASQSCFSTAVLAAAPNPNNAASFTPANTASSTSTSAAAERARLTHRSRPTPPGIWSATSRRSASIWASSVGRCSVGPGVPHPVLAYSETHPDRVTELVLRGIFLLRKQEIDWFYQRGASVLYPDAWEPYASHIPEPERGDLLMAYHRRLTSEDQAVRLAAAKIWSKWEGATSKLLPDAAFTAHYEEDEFALAFARIEAHYFANKGFPKDRRPAPRRRFADSPHSGRHRAGPLRCRLPHGECMGASSRVAGGRPHHHTR